MKNRRMLIGILIGSGVLIFVIGAAVMASSASLARLKGGDGPMIGVVRVTSVITGKTAQQGIAALRHFRKDEDVVAIVVRVDSPGGMVGPSQELYREIERTRKVKPVVASMGGVAASGGYYIAAACDEIVASPGTITGSIGVISQTTQVNELLAMAKIETHTFKSGKFKDTGSPLRTMGEEEKTYMQDLILEIHSQFVDDVAKGRKLTRAKVKKVADGRILSGRKAKEHKLVDRLGNYSDALEAAAKLAKEEGEPVPVVYKPRKSFMAELLEESFGVVIQEMRSSAGRSTSVEVRAPGL